ncbi:MAG: hypothetical protein FJW35_17310 [Acidobacteria bacterium]|nr:hypothetical protein [Acidobacteriota bacterium]
MYGVPTTSTKAVSLGAAFGRVYMSYVFEEPGGGERAVAHVSFKLGAAPALNDLSRAVLQNHLSEPLSTVDDPASAGALFYWGSRLWFAYSIDLTIGEDHEGLFFKYKKGY